jgi:ElaB/YqjD/DUF883 family membrane-anchored ribosome-binding protein
MGQSTEELTGQIEDTRQRMANDLDTLQERVSPSAIVERRKQAARHRLSSMKDKVMGTAQSAKDSMSSAASAAPDAGSLASTAQSQVEGAPLAAGLAAFGVGVVVAALLPASRAEAEVAHRVVETAKEQGGPMLEDAKSAGADVAQSLKESATQAAQEVKESAQQSAQHVKEEGTSSAQSVRDQATS